MSLRDDIQAFMTQFLKNVPENIQHLMQEEAERLARSGIAEKGLKAGDKAPPFVLPDTLGHRVASEELLRRGPLVVSFYRGGW